MALFKKKERTPNFVQRDYFSFRVAGVMFDNDDGTNRQEVLSKIADELKYLYSTRYGGYKNKEIEEDDLTVRELEGLPVEGLEINETTFDGKLAYEVKSLHGQVGFVPADRCDDLKALIEKHDEVTMTATLTGGKVKSFDHDVEKVKIKVFPYGMEIDLKFETPRYI